MILLLLVIGHTIASAPSWVHILLLVGPACAPSSIVVTSGGCRIRATPLSRTVLLLLPLDGFLVLAQDIVLADLGTADILPTLYQLRRQVARFKVLFKALNFLQFFGRGQKLCFELAEGALLSDSVEHGLVEQA